LELFNKILSLTQSSTGISACDSDTDRNVCATVKKYEREIDKLVYKLYGLTDEEIRIVEEVNLGCFEQQVW